MRWRIYYDDGTTYEGDCSEDAMNAPATGVLLTKHESFDEDNWRGFTLRKGSYFYCWERIRLSDGTWTDEFRWGGKDDLFGLMDYFTNQPGWQKVLVGREVHDATYRDVIRIAERDGCLCLEPCDHKV